MDKPLVTIITATYNLIKNNRKDYFIQMVNSVKNQTYDNIEHLIIDGGSNDGSIELFKELGLKYISEKDKGIYDAFNKGLNHASGKYINFMNSDDFFNNNKAVELSVQALEKKKADFSCAKASIIFDNGQTNVMKPNINKVYLRMPFCHQTMFARVDKMRELGGFDMNFKSASDYDLILRFVLAKSKYVVLKDNIVTFRNTGESAVHVRLSVEEQIKILIKNYNKYKKYDDSQYFLFYVNEYLPLSLAFKLHSISISSVFRFIKMFLRTKRRDIIHFCSSDSKDKRALSLFGFYIIKPKAHAFRDFKTIGEYIGDENADSIR